MTGKFTIRYPSGRRFQLRGELRVVDLGVTGLNPVIVAGDAAHILDPRAVVRLDGQVVYTPRMVPLDGLTKDMRRWLLDHPEWASEVTA